MSGKVRHVDFSPDEYIAGVGNVLRADEQGVYWMVCSLIMSEGGPVQFDDRRIAGLTRIRPAEARKIIEKLIAMHKLSLTESGLLSQKRAQSEVERSANRIQIASENGAKGGRPKKKPQENQQDEKPDGLSAEKLTTNYQRATMDIEVSDETSNLRPKKRTRHTYSEAFERFWSAYPTDALMSKLDASREFEALEPVDQDAAISSVGAFVAYCSARSDYRPVHANRYLKSRRFDGFNKTAERVSSKEWVRFGSSMWEAIRLRRGVASMAHSENKGERGWWFDKTEIENAKSRAAA